MTLFALLLAAPTLGAAQAAADTSRARAAADSTRRGAVDSSAAVPPAAGAAPTGAAPTSPPPGAAILPVTDTTLARACRGARAGTEAPGLLAVVFRPGTSDRERAAAAKAVGGTLAGTSGYGEEYVQLPVGAGPLVAVADRLIRQDPVTRVSPAPCPAAAGGATGGETAQP